MAAAQVDGGDRSRRRLSLRVMQRVGENPDFSQVFVRNLSDFCSGFSGSRGVRCLRGAMDPGSTSEKLPCTLGGGEGVVPMDDEKFVFWALLSIARLAVSAARLLVDIVDRKRKSGAPKKKRPS